MLQRRAKVRDDVGGGTLPKLLRLITIGKYVYVVLYLSNDDGAKKKERKGKKRTKKEFSSFEEMENPVRIQTSRSAFKEIFTLGRNAYRSNFD